MRKTIEPSPMAKILSTPSSDKDPNSQEYAIQVDHFLMMVWVSLSKHTDEFKKYLENIKAHETYRKLVPPFATYEEYIQSRTGCAEDIVIPMYIERRKQQEAFVQDRAGQAEPNSPNGTNQYSERGFDNYQTLSNDGGTDPGYLLSRIARDRPDILDDMKLGKYKSTRQGAIAAGIIDPEKSARYSLPMDPRAAAEYLRQRVDSNWIVTMYEAFFAKGDSGAASLSST